MSQPARPRAHFALFGFPIRIHPFFWILPLFIGASAGAEGADLLARVALLGLVLFVSILWHELGHAFAMRNYGYSPWIELHGMGGRTGWGAGPGFPSAKQRIAVSLAGPFAGFILGGFAWAIQQLAGAGHHWALDFTLSWMVLANVFWGACNLIPMLPWDGGLALHGILDIATGGKGLRPTAFVTIAVAALIAGLVLHFLPGWWWPLILCGLSVAVAVRALRTPAPVAVPTNGKATLAHAREALERAGDPEALVNTILFGASSEDWRPLAKRLEASAADPGSEDRSQVAVALELGGWAHLLAGNVRGADRCAESMRPSHDPSPILAATIAIRAERFEEALEATHDMGDEEGRIRRKLSAYALAALGRVDEAVDAVEGDWDAGAFVDAAFFHGTHFDEAAELGGLLFERFGKAEDAYNTACSHARAGRPAEGLRWLGRAVDAGYVDLTHLEEDEDLATVRALAGYGPIRERISASA